MTALDDKKSVDFLTVKEKHLLRMEQEKLEKEEAQKPSEIVSDRSYESDELNKLVIDKTIDIVKNRYHQKIE